MGLLTGNGSRGGSEGVGKRTGTLRARPRTTPLLSLPCKEGRKGITAQAVLGEERVVLRERTVSVREGDVSVRETQGTILPGEGRKNRHSYPNRRVTTIRHLEVVGIK